MSSSTTNLNLTKPAGDELYDIGVFNGNADKIDTFAGQTTTALAGKADSSSLATVATSGKYTDLTDTPTIPTVDTTLDGTSANAIANSAVVTGLAGKYGLGDQPQAINNGTDVMTLGPGVYAKALNVDTLIGTPADFNGTYSAFLLIVRVAFYDAGGNPWRRQFLIFPTSGDAVWQDRLVYRCTEKSTAGTYTDWVRFPDGQTIARRTAT